MSDNFITANQALRGQEKKGPHLGIRVPADGKRNLAYYLDCMNQGVCTRCGIFKSTNAIFCKTCYALMHTGIERAERLSTMGLTEAEARKEVNWVGP